MSSVGLAWEQFRLERKLFWRNPSAAFFNFLLPLLFLVLVASLYAGDDGQLDILIPGIAGMGVMASTFSALAFNVTFLREQGILKRIRGTPLPTVSYLAGLLGSAVVNAFAEVAIVVLIGRYVYGVELPQNPLLLVGFTALGVVTFGSLGIALSHAIPNFDSAAAYVNAIFLPLILISGVFASSESVPAAIEAVAQVFPLTHLIDGLSAAIVGGASAGAELSAALIVGGWALAGVFVAVRWFRWE